MPKKVTAFRCQYCKDLYGVLADCTKHEGRCRCNPGRATLAKFNGMRTPKVYYDALERIAAQAGKDES